MAGGEALGVAGLVALRVRLLVGRDLRLGGGVVDRRRRRASGGGCGESRLRGSALTWRIGRRVRLQVRVFREEERALRKAEGGVGGLLVDSLGMVADGVEDPECRVDGVVDPRMARRWRAGDPKPDGALRAGFRVRAFPRTLVQDGSAARLEAMQKHRENFC